MEPQQARCRLEMTTSAVDQGGAKMANIGAGLDAVKDAIGFYMELRQQKEQNRRSLEADSRAKRQLDLLESQHDQQQEDRVADNERDALKFQMERYGGSTIDPATAGRARAQGFGGAIEQGMTLPSSTLPMSTGAPQMGPTSMNGGGGMPEGMSSPMSTIAQRSPAQPTGEERWKMPATERMQLAYYNANAARERNLDTIAGRASEGTANRAVRLAQIRSAMNNAEAARQLM